MRLTARDAEGFAVLIVHQLNVLFSETCCYRCCAPCAYLWELAQDEDILEEFLGYGPPELVDDWLFEDGYKPEVRERPGRLSREWLLSRMMGSDNEPCPMHEDEEE